VADVGLVEGVAADDFEVISRPGEGPPPERPRVERKPEETRLLFDPAVPKSTLARL
jgi:hypothetical protein